MKILQLKNNFLIFCCLVFLSLYHSSAQTIPCDLGFKDGTGMKKTRLVGIHEDLLLVADTGNYKIINVEKITRVRFDKGNYFWAGMGIGAATGFVGGIVLYELFSEKKKKLFTKDATLGITLVFVLPGAILGSLVGLAFRNVDNYDISNMAPYVKSKEIKFMMQDHSEWR
jgi:hypothetical protein